MQRAYLHRAIDAFVSADASSLLGELVRNHGHALEPAQRDAWTAQIDHLREVLLGLSGHIFVEFVIPRMGRRADVILLVSGIVFVLEYKVGAYDYEPSATRQCVDYALDLKYFHAGSHARRIVPIVVATEAPSLPVWVAWQPDGMAAPARANRATLRAVIDAHAADAGATQPDDDWEAWLSAPYKPTPTIIEAARALYEGHRVEEISRSEAGATNLAATASAIDTLIAEAKRTKRKTACFVTGVPGSGKTLAGLNIATRRLRAHHDEHAVFLSGNGPLVDVLRAALTRDEVHRESTVTRAEANKRAKTFIQNIHHFRDDNLTSAAAPAEHVVVFDEAQRAWDREQTSKFMRKKRHQPDFNMSEPEFLLSVMDRHEAWCVVVCLVGEGQEINTGEAGIEAWLDALRARFSHWQVALSPHVPLAKAVAESDRCVIEPALHLNVSVRSFRAESTSAFVAAVLDADTHTARQHIERLREYPIMLTRDLAAARAWLRRQARGSERFGFVASSNALRLKPIGLHVKAKIDPVCWFLNEADDVRSSYALEDPASEFDIQGLELDWVGVCWDANVRFIDGAWSLHEFRGSAWLRVSARARREYLRNAYRVLLTRARQGMVIVVPEGDDRDPTRRRAFYDGTFGFLRELGIRVLNDARS